MRLVARRDRLSAFARLTAMMLVDDEFGAEECRQTVQAYCHEVVLAQPTAAPPAGA